MPPLILSSQLVLSMLALSASYALVMSLLKKEVNVKWVRTEAILMLMGSGASLGLAYSWFFGSFNWHLIVSVTMLVIGLSLSLAIVFIHRLTIAKSATYPVTLTPILKKLSIGAFTVFLFHMFFEVAAIAWS